MRFVISEAVSGAPKDLMIHDVMCAFLHASMEGEIPVTPILPLGLTPDG